MAKPCQLYTIDDHYLIRPHASGNGRQTPCISQRVLYIMDILQQKSLGSVRTPLGGDKVYKDECIYSFDTPVSIDLIRIYIQLSLHLNCQESEGGLYVSLSSFLGVSGQFLDLHYQKTEEDLYLHIKKIRKV